MKKVLAAQFEPIDFPEDDSPFLHGVNSIHISSPLFMSDYGEDLYWSVREDFEKWVNMAVERGAIRGRDYIITISTRDGRYLPEMTLHTTTNFIPKEDV